MTEFFFILAGVFFGWTLLAMVGWVVSHTVQKLECLSYPCAISAMLCGFAAGIMLLTAVVDAETVSPKEAVQFMERITKE